ncbi:MAG: cysteine--tRNA ligase, partial [Candidatus Omnitrophota bacterium]
PEMLKFIQGLIDKGYAYATFTGVYFSVRKFKGYGKLSGQSIEQMLTGVRKDADETKEDPLDFALWKKSKPGEPFWPSPWGEGRPGWHIECSVMSAKYLNTETLDIHAGGRDLIFPHHENEIAQAEALTGKLFAKYWIHHGLLAINSQKMSKSLGNFVTIKGFLEKHKYPDVLKLFFLSAHYSHPVDYTEEKIQEARTALERVHILLGKVSVPQCPVSQSPVSSLQSPVLQSASKEIMEIRNKFIEAMDDDFNTPQGLARIFDLVRLMNNKIEDVDFVLEARDVLFELTNIFALDLTKTKIQTQTQTLTSDSMIVIPNVDVEELIKKRNEAKKKKDFKEADEIRKDLEAQGIILEDTKDGTTWRRKL